MPSVSPKKSTKPMTAAKSVMHDGHGVAWHSVLWIAVVAVTLSGATIALSAMAQGSTGDYPSTNEGILQAISDLRADVNALKNK